MTDLDDLPELVRHLRLDADFRHKRTVHRFLNTRQGSQRKETWMREKKIGHGGYGEVWLERRVENQRSTSGAAELRAVKCIHASLQRKEYSRELEALATFSSNKSKYNDFFVQFHGWFESTEWLHAVMEYCEHGDLRDYLGSHGRLPETEAQDIARQLLVGVRLMHEAGFAHRDIKPANVLVKSAPPAHWWVKLGDLGLSKRAEAVSGSSTIRATPGFVPPELYGLTREDPKHINPFYSDVWCLAETVFRILTDREAFDSIVKLSDYVGHRIPFPEEALIEASTSEPGITFVQTLMAPFPLERMTAEQALKHPWILLDEDEKSDADDVPNIQDNSTEPNVSPGWDEDITQPAANWTTDVETADLETLSKLSTKVDELDGHTTRHGEQLMPCDSTRTIRVRCRSKHQAYVEDEISAGIITHSSLADLIIPAIPEDVDEDTVVNHVTEQKVRGKEGARIHFKGDDTGDISVPSSERFACTAQHRRPSITKSPDLLHPRPSSPIHNSSLRPPDQEQCSLDSLGDTHDTKIQRGSTQGQELEHMEGLAETKAQKFVRAKSLPNGREKMVRFIPQSEINAEKHAEKLAELEEAYSFVSTLGSSSYEAKRFTWLPADRVSKRLLDDVLGYRYGHVHDRIQFLEHLSGEEIMTILRLSRGDRKGLDPLTIEDALPRLPSPPDLNEDAPTQLLSRLSLSRLTEEALARIPSADTYARRHRTMSAVADNGHVLCDREHCRACWEEFSKHERSAPMAIRGRCYNCKQPVDAYQGNIGRHVTCRPCGASLGWLPPIAVNNLMRHADTYQPPRDWMNRTTIADPGTPRTAVQIPQSYGTRHHTSLGDMEPIYLNVMSWVKTVEIPGEIE